MFLRYTNYDHIYDDIWGQKIKSSFPRTADSWSKETKVFNDKYHNAWNAHNLPSDEKNRSKIAVGTGWFGSSILDRHDHET